jgi:hypothetical protein
MTELGFSWWFLVVVGGTLVLGVAIAYGFIRSRQRTRREKLAGEQGAHEVYEKEDRAPGP